MKKAIAIAYLISFTVAAHGQQSSSAFQWAVNASGYDFYPNLVYKKANGRELKLDVVAIEPLSTPKPTLLYIHGGGWVNGTKENTTLAVLPYLAAGMNTVNIDYRLAEDSLAPAAVEDCRCALRWVYRHAKDYGFDTSKIVVGGESAGGHLALMTAMLDASIGLDNECPAQDGDLPLKAAAVVSYSGPTDLPELLEGANQRWFALTWFGSLPNRMDLARRLSPLSYVNPSLPPIIQVHSEQDPYVPYDQVLRLHQALDRAKVPNELITLSGATHGWAVEKELGVEEQVFRALSKFGVLSQRSLGAATNIQGSDASK